MTTKELLDEYYWCKVSSEIPTNTIKHQNLERMQEIIKELEASIRKEVINGIINCGVSSDCIYYNEIEEYALSKGIDIK